MSPTVSEDMAASSITNIPLTRDEQGNVRVDVYFPDYAVKKTFTFDPDENVWDAKLLVLEAVDKQLEDPLNYGLYLPPYGGRAGKFLDEERPLDDYKLPGPIGQLEFKYKRRVYRVSNLNHRKLRQLHTKSTLKQFVDAVKANSLDKVNKLIEKGLDPNYVDSDGGETPLTLATKVKGCRNLILQLVSGGAHLDFRNQSTLTPMHTAAIHGNAEAIKALLELGGSPNYKDIQRLTPLYHLAKKRNSPALCAELLLRDYALIGCKDEAENTELHQACKVGNYRIAELLIFYGAEMDYQNANGATPLHISAASNELSCLQTLLVRGADKTLLNNAKQSAYDIAVVAGYKDVANTLAKHDELLVVPFEDSPSYNPNRRLAGANLEAMRLLSRSDPRINLSSSVMNLATDNLYGSKIGNRADLGHLALGVGENGMWEGKLGEKQGWFPSNHVTEKHKRNTISAQQTFDENVIRRPPLNRSLSVCDDRNEGARTVVLAKTKKGYGFVLRGAKAEQLRKLEVEFVPTEKMPALQYLDSVEKGSVSDKAGLRAGDFILEIDGVNVVHFSHERTVALIKKAGDILAMKVIRAVRSDNQFEKPDGTQTLPRPKPTNLTEGSSDVILRKKTLEKVANGGLTEEDQAIDVSNATEQLDATLANYDSDSRSSSSGTVQTREQKVASIRQRPSSSHFNSIQELDDMFLEPSKKTTSVPVPSLPTENQVRRPAKNKVKKFWNRSGKTNKLDKTRSLSQPNLAKLSNDEIQPITMHEMRVGHSIDAESVVRTRSSTSFSGGSLSSASGDAFVPPPPAYPAPEAPGEGRLSISSGNNFASAGPAESSFRPGMIAQTSVSTAATIHDSLEKKRYLPRTPLPLYPSSQQTSPPTGVGGSGSTLPRIKNPPAPPSRSSSHESPVLMAIQGQKQSQHPEQSQSASQDSSQAPDVQAQVPSLAKKQSAEGSSLATSEKLEPPEPRTSAFADEIRRAAEAKSVKETSTTKSAPKIHTSTSVGDELYNAVQRRQTAVNAADIDQRIAESKAIPNPVTGTVSVEDQLKLAVAKRRTALEQRKNEDTDSDRSNTPDRTLAPPAPPKLDAHAAPDAAMKANETSSNFRELAEQKRLEYITRKKSMNSIDPQQNGPSVPPVLVHHPDNSKTSPDSPEKSLTELQQIMSRLGVSSVTEENNNKKKVSPPQVMKKPPRTDLHRQEIHLSPVAEFPPPPPPAYFDTLLIPPPNFLEDQSTPSQISPPPPDFGSDLHDGDNHSVTSSGGSDTISSVSQDYNRTSVGTSGYGSDPSRSVKVHAGKPVDTWSCEEVAEWLDAIGLGEYREVFVQNCIEGETLISMSKADIKELGVEKLGHRVKLDKEIQRLSSAESNA